MDDSLRAEAATAGMTLRIILAPPDALEEALLDRIRRIRERDALAPIDVVVGGILQRPYLQRRIADTSPGLVNVRFSTLGELGLRLGEPALAASGRRPLPAIAERAYVAEIARTSSGYFEPVAATPGFSETARRLVRELRQEQVSPTEFRRLAPVHTDSQAKGEALADLYARYLERRADAYDGEDAISAATPTAFDGVELLLFGIWRMGSSARRLVEAIATRVPVTIFLPSVVPEVDDVHAELRAWATALHAPLEHLSEEELKTGPTLLGRRLFSPGDAIPDDGSIELVSAPDPLAETREAARACLVWAEAGIAFREMAVTYRQAEVYRPLIEALFAEAGIPVYLDDGPSLAERPLGRRILALLDLIDSPLRRRDVIAFLSDGRMPKKTRERFGGAPAARWDSASRRAGVVEGIDQWRQRLTLLRDAESKAAQEENAPEWLAGRVADCETLLAFVEEFAGTLARHPARTSWVASLAYLRELLATYVHGSEDVLGYLDALTELDRLVPEVEFPRFLEVVRAEVRALKAGDLDEGRQGAFGRRGVNILDLNQLRHLRFRAIAILGLTERTFPPPPRQDPLLLDDERRQLNEAAGWTLPLRALGADPEPMQYALGVYAARERLVLSTRRAEEAGGRKQLPSAFFRAAASALEGRRVSIDDVAELSRVRRVPSGRLGATDPEHALTLVERDRTLLELDPPLGRGLLERLEPRAARADELRRARWGVRALTPFDGALADADAVASLEEEFVSGRLLSPTGLEEYAKCPFKYFLRNVLRVRPLDEPERLLRIDALTRGKLVHEVLKQFVDGLEAEGLDVNAVDILRSGLVKLAEAALDQAEAAGLTGAPLLWRGDRQEIIDDLVGWLTHEYHDPGPYTTRALEVPFGGTWAGDEKNPLASDEPLKLTVGDRTLRLRGRIDRIDYKKGAGFRVVDYKTGKGPNTKEGSLDHGQALQLPLYLLAVGWLLGLDPAKGEAAYHMVSRRGEFRRIAFTGKQLEERRGQFDQVLLRIADGIATGDFHLEPGDQCRFCDYDGLCDVGRRRIMSRKSGDPRAASFRDLKAIE